MVTIQRKKNTQTHFKDASEQVGHHLQHTIKDPTTFQIIANGELNILTHKFVNRPVLSCLRLSGEYMLRLGFPYDARVGAPGR